MILSTDNFIQAVQRAGDRITLGAGDFELDAARLGSVELPSLIIEGSGAPNTRLHVDGFLNLHWRHSFRDLAIFGDDLFDLTNAPYSEFRAVTFNSSAAKGQSHLQKTYADVKTRGTAIRIGADAQARGQDNTYRISFIDCEFNFYQFPFDLRSSEWINAFELDGVVVNGAEIGLYAEAINLRARDTNFQCCEYGWVLAGNQSRGERIHFERGKQDIIFGEFSYGNVIETDAKTVDDRTKVFPQNFPPNQISTYRAVNGGRFNAARRAALQTWRAAR